MNRSNQVTIGEHCGKVSSWNPIQDAPEDVIKYIDIAAIDRDSKKIVNVSEVLGIDAPSRARQLVMTGDVLVSTVRPNLNAVALVSTEFDGATASTGFTVLRPHPNKLDNSYLFHWVKSPAFVQEMVQQATGASYPAVSDSIVKRSIIPLPPLAEQQRIATLLDKADALREKRRQALAKLDALLQSVFLEMFGDPMTNPKGWEIKTLSELLLFKTGKLDSNAMVEGGEYPFFTCSRETYQIDHYAFDCEALLLAGNNANADYSVKYYNGKFNAYQRTYVITLQNSKHSYLYMKTALEKKLQELKQLSKGTNTKYLTLSILQKLKIQSPDSGTQAQFESLVATLDCERKKSEESLRRLDELFSSIQHRAFSGELFTDKAAAAIQQELFAE